MHETTTATWRFGIGERVRWVGDGAIRLIGVRRWTERPLLPPYAEYQIALDLERIWVGEADLAAAGAGEGEA